MLCFKQGRNYINTMLKMSFKLRSNDNKIGQTLKVIIDKEEGDYYIGRTEFDSPEVDPEVLIKKNKMLNIGEFYDVKITGTQSFDLYGEVL